MSHKTKNGAKKDPAAEQERVLKERQLKAARAQQSVAAAVACDLCPDITAEVGIKVLTMQAPRETMSCMSASLVRRARTLIADDTWRTEFFAWLDAYWAAHHHGPTWRTLRTTEEIWPQDGSLVLRRAVLRTLPSSGHVDGTRVPYGLCVRRRK